MADPDMWVPILGMFAVSTMARRKISSTGGISPQFSQMHFFRIASNT